MFSRSVNNTKNTNRDTRTHAVTGHWYLSGEREEVQSA
jgi:hypothetical protein